jgi:vancomycin resistance protein YoaR
VRNAGASIDPPTDPLAAVSLPLSSSGRGPAPQAGERHEAGRSGGLPPGVSPDIFGATGLGRPGAAPGSPSLPPVPPPPQPWPMAREPGPPRPPMPPPHAGMERSGPPPGPVDGPPPDGPPRRRRGLLSLAVTLPLILVLAYVVPAVLMSGTILRGTVVEGIDIGGLTVTQAADRLRDGLAPLVDRPLVLQAAGRRHELVPEDAGLEVDVVGTIERAPSGFPTPVQVWQALVGTTEVKPKIVTDAGKLAEAVDRLAGRIDRKVVEGAIRFKGTTPVVTRPRDGRALEREPAATKIAAAFLGPGTPVDLPVTVVKPRVSAKAVAEAAANARKAVAGPVTLTHGGRRAQLSAETLAAHLTFVAGDDGALRPKFDANSALGSTEKDLIDAAQAPKNATFEIVDGRPRLVPARRGKGVDRAKLAGAVATMVSEGGSRTIPVELTLVQPRITDKIARGLGIKEKISEFTTQHPCCAPRVTNIHRIADLLDGHMVLPGETFSLNGVVGQRDRARGFVEAPMILAGRLVNDVGGGISQFATTMYNAVFFGGLQDVQHTPHEFYISRYPAGRESTVSWPQPDFRWRNDSDHGVLVKTSYTATSITVAFWSTKRYDRVEAKASEPYDFTDFKKETDSGPDCIPMTGQRGFTIDVTRVFYNGGKEVKRDPTIRTVYKPELDLTCEKPSSQ